jgi:hypothetical protein
MMLRTLRRGLCGTLLMGLIGLAGPMSARGALELWTLVGLPLTATAGQLTTFTLTATNALVPNGIGCLEVDLPPSFGEVSVAITQTPEGRPWMRRVTGRNVELFSDGGGGRLRLLQSMTFMITARPSVAGVTSWPTHAHERHDCEGANLPGFGLPVTVVPQLLPTPVPSVPATPVPLPTPTFSALPMPLPTLIPTQLPGVLPTPRPRAAPHSQPPLSTQAAVPPSPSAALASASATPSPPPSRSDATATPAASADVPRASDEPAAVAQVRPPSTPGAAPAVVFDPADVRVDLSTGSLLAGFETWAVPAATLGLPGLLVMLFVALQATGALAWMPVVRRFRGDDEEPSHDGGPGRNGASA